MVPDLSPKFSVCKRLMVHVSKIYSLLFNLKSIANSAIFLQQYIYSYNTKTIFFSAFSYFLPNFTYHRKLCYKIGGFFRKKTSYNFLLKCLINTFSRQ